MRKRKAKLRDSAATVSIWCSIVIILFVTINSKDTLLK